MPPPELSVKEARRQVRKAERELGSEHDETLKARGALARALTAAGDFTSARLIQEELLKSWRRTQPEDGWEIVKLSHSLGITLRNLKEYESARRLQEYVLEVYLSRCIPDSPPIRAAMNNLTITLRDQGDLEALSKLEDQLVGLLERSIGIAHPDTINEMEWAATTKASLHDYEGATALRLKNFNRCLKEFGPADLKTLKAEGNLGLSLIMTEDIVSAKEHMVRAADAAARTLPPGDATRSSIEQGIAAIDDYFFDSDNG